MIRSDYLTPAWRNAFLFVKYFTNTICAIFLETLFFRPKTLRCYNFKKKNIIISKFSLWIEISVRMSICNIKKYLYYAKLHHTTMKNIFRLDNGKISRNHRISLQPDSGYKRRISKRVLIFRVQWFFFINLSFRNVLFLIILVSSFTSQTPSIIIYNFTLCFICFLFNFLRFPSLFDSYWN